MKLDWFQVVTNLGVIAGLIVLIYQVNQANQHMAAQLIDSNLQMAHQTVISVLGEDPAAVVAKARDDMAKLSVEERVILDAYHKALYNDLYQRWIIAQTGVFADFRGTGVELHAYVFAYPAGRIWWKRYRDIAPPELREVIDSAIGKEDFGATQLAPYE